MSDCSKERIRLFIKSRPTSPRNLRTNLKRRRYHTWLDRPWTQISEWMFGSPADGMTHWTFGRQLEALLFNLSLKSLLYKNCFFASSSKRHSLTHYRASFWVILSQQVFWARLRTERLLMKPFFFSFALPFYDWRRATSRNSELAHIAGPRHIFKWLLS